MNIDTNAPIQKLINYFNDRISLTKKDEALIAASYKTIEIKKKGFLFQQGEICNQEGFVTKGTFRVFYSDEKGLEHVLYFAFENWWVGDIASFYEQEPSRLSVQALEDSQLLIIERAEKEKIYQEIPALEKVFRIITQKHLTVLQKRFLITVSANVETRYNELLQRCPGIEQLVPQHQIASYLGILPESLSRMKKQLIKK